MAYRASTIIDINSIAMIGAGVITGINSITSASGNDFVLSTGTSGAALTFTSASNLATFSGVVRADNGLGVGIAPTGALPVNFSFSSNAFRGLGVGNSTSGSGAVAGVQVGSTGGSNNTYLEAYSSGYTTSGLNIAYSGQIRTASGVTGGIVIRTQASAPIIFGTSDTERLRITDSAMTVASSVTTLTLNSTQSSTSTTTGALVVSGGVGISGSIYAGVSIVVQSNITAIGGRFFGTGNGVNAHQFGFATFLRPSIGTTSTDGISIENTTAAAADAQQYSPRTRWSGKGWKTDATAASQSVNAIAELRPVQGTSAPTGIWALAFSINGSGYSDGLTLTSAGELTISSTITTTGGATFHTTNTALTDGAGAATGTLLNAPSAGNPTKWIGINDNGTTRYIPAW